MSFNRFLRNACLGALGVGSIAAMSTGCLDRPVAPATPKTTARNIDRVRQTAVDKIDLLFMIDNSISMADKHNVLAQAVPDLVRRLVDPDCVEIVGDVETPVTKNEDGTCPDGSQREFEPVNDIHIGVISSSIGTNGAVMCSPAMSGGYDPTMEDMSHLLSRNLDGSPITTYENKGFLQWDPLGEKSPAGENDQAKLSSVFTDMVIGVGQTGCGYEQSLEAVYRFLVDPQPYKKITLVDEGATPWADLGPEDEVDETLLQQRADFLRPDSLVAIVSLTDENDCSTIAGDRWYLSLESDYKLTRGNSACQDDPNSECCGPCRGWNPPGHCTQPADDAECQIDEGFRPDGGKVNLRCFDQKRRYGYDFLYPTDRYVEAMQKRVVPNRQGEMVQNPLFMDLQCGGVNCKPERDDSFIYWAMIVGVPWQDIARVNDSGLPDLSLGYMTTAEMAMANEDGHTRWDIILGDPSNSPPIPPLDPFMIETISEREGVNPITHDPIVRTDPANPPPLDSNSINGHERDLSTDLDDLQYACIFRLPQPVVCQDEPCDCDRADESWQDPLCQNPETGEFQRTIQYSAKAYPGVRHLQVAQGLGDQAIVASICPTNLEDPAAVDYGYRPAIAALIERLKEQLRGRCLPRALEPNVCGIDEDDPTYGQVPCVILETQTIGEGDACDCNRPGRNVPNEATITDEVREGGNCICEITQLEGAGLRQCEKEPDENQVNADGWCYVDPAQGIGVDEIVKSCPENEKRLIRFVNKGNPENNATVFITCQEGAYNPAATPDGEQGDICAAL